MDGDLRGPLTWVNWVAQLISRLVEITLTTLCAGDHSESITCRFLLVEMKCWLFIAQSRIISKGVKTDCELSVLTCVRPITEEKYRACY